MLIITTATWLISFDHFNHKIHILIFCMNDERKIVDGKCDNFLRSLADAHIN